MTDALTHAKRNREALQVCHTGGIDTSIVISLLDLPTVLDRLTHCKEHSASHVFIVDQSHTPRITVGVSRHGYECAMNVLDRLHDD